MTQLLFAANQIQTVRQVKHDGRDYLIAPVVALRQGVLNGVLVMADEFGRYVESWNGRAVPLNHPRDDSGYISANSPQVWASEVLGTFFNAQVDGDKLRGELWIDLNKAQQLGGKAMTVVSRLRANQPVEVSTGYFADLEETSGTWEGRAYVGIARNIRPDHLALLPDEVGACSWQDGCGAPRVNVREPMHVNEMDLDDRASLVRRAFRMQQSGNSDFDDVDTVAVFDDTLIVKHWSTKTHAAYGYTVTPAGEVTFGEAQPVEVVYRGKDGGAEVVVVNREEAEATATTPVERNLFKRFSQWLSQGEVEGITKDQDMTKCDLVKAITANSRNTFSAERLNGWEVADLQALHDSLHANEEQAATPVEPVAPVAPVAEVPAELAQFAQMIQALGGVEKLGAALGAITANADTERAELVSVIVANSRNTLDAADFQAMPLPVLRKLAGALAPANYSGAAGVVANRQTQPEFQPLAMPKAWVVKEDK